MPLYSHSVDAPKSLSDIVTLELDMRWSRESGVLAPHDDIIPMGAVLALNADGKYVPYMTELESDSEGDSPAFADQAAAVLISKDRPASAEDQPCSVLKRGACVAAANILWADGVTEPQKQTAIGQLAALGVVPKE